MATATRPRARAEAHFACSACDAISPRWVGRCPMCGGWNTIARIDAATRLGAVVPASSAVALRDVSSDEAQPLPTGLAELDRVMAGGVVPGSVTLLFGPPGIGKSTLLFQVLTALASTGVDVMLASAEESLAQVRGRAGRVGRVPAHLLALEGPDVEAIEAAVGRHRPAIVV